MYAVTVDGVEQFTQVNNIPLLFKRANIYAGTADVMLKNFVAGDCSGILYNISSNHLFTVKVDMDVGPIWMKIHIQIEIQQS